MPTLDFKGKQHIYAHHLTVPYRPDERSLNPTALDDNLIIHGDNSSKRCATGWRPYM